MTIIVLLHHFLVSNIGKSTCQDSVVHIPIGVVPNDPLLRALVLTIGVKVVLIHELDAGKELWLIVFSFRTTADSQTDRQQEKLKGGMVHLEVR